MFSGELFHDVQPLVQSALDGYNVAIFAYGQSRSGKTHTLVVIYSNDLFCTYFPWTRILFKLHLTLAVFGN